MVGIFAFYRESYREILSADASVVDLHRLGPYYYSFGTHVLKFELPDTSDVAKMLIKVSYRNVGHI